MGMYTHVRGWILLKGLDMTPTKFNEIIKLAEGISPRSNQCITCTVFNKGFIGGKIKNYDDDWETYLKFIKDNFDIQEYKLELQYEEYDYWDSINLD